MTKPIAVAVVRPQRKPAEVVARVAILVGLLFLTCWWLMLAVAFVTPWHLSYWQTVVGVISIRTVQIGSGYLQWTWGGKEVSAR